jgi:hypothetical protein
MLPVGSSVPFRVCLEVAMGEVFVEFENVLTGPNGRRYMAQACGRQRADGLWEGWVEFTPVDGSAALRTERETTQPNREDARYWATGLTHAYLEGALERILKAPPPPPLPPAEAGSVFDGPAEPEPRRPAMAAAAQPVAVLDPFRVYAEGDALLRGQLGALSGAQLRNIIRAHDLSEATSEELALMPDAELVLLIMDAVQHRAE